MGGGAQFFYLFLLVFWVFLVHPNMVSVLLSASVERCFVSRMRDFFQGYLRCDSTDVSVVLKGVSGGVSGMFQVSFNSVSGRF